MTDARKREGRAEARQLRIDGELTIYTVGRHAPELFGAAGGAIALDLSQVPEIDTAGLQLLLAARSAATARGGTLRLARSSPAVREALGLLRLHASFGAAAEGQGAGAGSAS